MSADLRYDDVQHAMSIVTDKIEESKTVQRMKEKNPVCSCGWTIADTRCYMVSLQCVAILVCIISLAVTYSQYQLSDIDIECEGDFKMFGPYYGETTVQILTTTPLPTTSPLSSYPTSEPTLYPSSFPTSEPTLEPTSPTAFPTSYPTATTLPVGTTHIYGCPWPATNTIIRAVPPLIGLITSIITVVLAFCIGSFILRDMDIYNDDRKVGDKREFADLYSYYCYFRFIRKVIGYCGYLQFISFGVDLCSYFIGTQYASTILNIADNDISNFQFQIPLIVAIPVAIVLRLTHDSMWQNVYKHKFNLVSDKGYHGHTVTEPNVNVNQTITNAVSVVAMSNAGGSQAAASQRGDIAPYRPGPQYTNN